MASIRGSGLLGRLAGLACVAVTLTGLGCGDTADSVSSGVDLAITREFGHVEQDDHGTVPLERGDTMLRLLRRYHDVEIDESFGSVTSVDGIRQAKDVTNGWAIHFNGIEADPAPAELRVRRGDSVQVDLRYWDGALGVRAMVGAFPRPFTTGMEGRRFPTGVLCMRPGSDACRRVKRALTAAGVALVPPRRPPVQPAKEEKQRVQRARVIVGPWAEVRDIRWAKRIEGGRPFSGIFARFSASGDRLTLLDWHGSPVRNLGAGTGLVGAMKPTEEDLDWYVTGVDDRGVERAAAALDADVLRNAYAVAVTEGGVDKLPLRAR